MSPRTHGRRLRSAGSGLVRVAGIAVGLGAAWFTLRAVSAMLRQVEGRSMLPTHHPGDLLVVRRVDPGRLRVGDVVVVRDPRDPRRETVKRITALPHDLADLAGEVRSVPAGMFAVSGDNPVESTDSRRYGPVAADAIVGRVALRLWPPARRHGLTKTPA